MKKLVMKRAWEIKKQDNRNIFSICLKMAWAEVKKGARKMVELIGTEKQVAWAEEIRKGNIYKFENRIEGLKAELTFKVEGTREYIINSELIYVFEKFLEILKKRKQCKILHRNCKKYHKQWNEYRYFNGKKNRKRM